MSRAYVCWAEMGRNLEVNHVSPIWGLGWAQI